MGLKMGKATRDAFGDALLDLGKQNPRVVALDGDLCNSTKTEIFGKEFPDRFFNVGIAESNLVSMAGGLASCGKIPFVASFAAFMMCNAYDQLRMSVAFPNLNVKVVGSHGGISIGEDGPSQMAIEDVALACALPNFTVVVPADEVATHAAVPALAEHVGPTYMRVGRPKVPIVYGNGCDFSLGKANVLRDGGDVAIIANGLMVAVAVEAAEALRQRGIEARVIDMHTVKPIDGDVLLAAAKETKGLVVAEEHGHYGGLGSVVSQFVVEHHPCPVRHVNVGDQFAESGDPQGLFEKYGLTAADVIRAAQSLA
ncbi:MAG: transketolase family protein [Armatimonadetes bacterium]|nr:transketolase family protein [Armatimonadota bacterium]PIU62694.1 MAG: transketolase [Armatimonadetes bacterium CG07_land_8_20_14_0_80_59_28]PIX46017.1 MAG: transketolase [Armatimonadetes bacterium CG_4_8_14_3_um_filter_58_9]PIY41967.1 MAG: transketolase [Armatimonadetes bacterium CG_4_10_14_3_um_filter_59_10]PJB63284.1 MAG: transketolase [Armatimonadetes bacterium CG_4_9_14_3_um_filter_58_7]